MTQDERADYLAKMHCIAEDGLTRFEKRALDPSTLAVYGALGGGGLGALVNTLLARKRSKELGQKPNNTLSHALLGGTLGAAAGGGFGYLAGSGGNKFTATNEENRDTLKARLQDSIKNPDTLSQTVVNPVNSTWRSLLGYDLPGAVRVGTGLIVPTAAAKGAVAAGHMYDKRHGIDRLTRMFIGDVPSGAEHAYLKPERVAEKSKWNWLKPTLGSVTDQQMEHATGRADIATKMLKGELFGKGKDAKPLALKDNLILPSNVARRIAEIYSSNGNHPTPQAKITNRAALLQKNPDIAERILRNGGILDKYPTLKQDLISHQLGTPRARGRLLGVSGFLAGLGAQAGLPAVSRWFSSTPEVQPVYK